MNSRNVITQYPADSNYYNQVVGQAALDLSKYAGSNKESTEGKVLDPAISKIGKEIVDSIALHPDFIKQSAKVGEVSRLKGYEPFNWLRKDSPVRVSALLSAAKRHISKAQLGEDFNTEKTLNGEIIDIQAHHLDYAAYNLQMASHIIRHLREHDDRLFVDGELK